jgi:hypothetical protein
VSDRIARRDAIRHVIVPGARQITRCLPHFEDGSTRRSVTPKSSILSTMRYSAARSKGKLVYKSGWIDDDVE